MSLTKCNFDQRRRKFTNNKTQTDVQLIYRHIAIVSTPAESIIDVCYHPKATFSYQQWSINSQNVCPIAKPTRMLKAQQQQTFDRFDLSNQKPKTFKVHFCQINIGKFNYFVLFYVLTIVRSIVYQSAPKTSPTVLRTLCRQSASTSLSPAHTIL